jgi:hypothetical protein
MLLIKIRTANDWKGKFVHNFGLMLIEYPVQLL